MTNEEAIKQTKEKAKEEEELKGHLMTLIDYFVDKDFVAIKQGDKIYHFSRQNLG